MAAVPKTNVQRLLEAEGVAHRVAYYEVDPEDLSAAPVAAKIGMPLEQVFKTLAVLGDSGELALCCIPGDAELDLKKAAKVLGERRVAMLPLKELEPRTGYVRGGCSPLGTKKKFATLIDETATLFDEVSVSAGKRGVQVILDPKELAALAGALFADIT